MSEQASERLQSYADRMRTNPTKWEKMLWRRLKRGIKGVNFEQQIVIDNAIVDFYCHSALVAIELDGMQHDSHRDAQRDRQILNKGILVMRFPNPRSDAELNSILFRVWPECRHRIARGKRYLSTNPQRSQSLQGSQFYSLDSKKRENLEPMKQRETVEKEAVMEPKNQNTKELKVPQDTHKLPQRCGRQVYASKEVAQSTADGLIRMKILAGAEIEKCSVCGLIHIRELRRVSE
jgi:very-short-patch-repair endonuclease